MSTLHFAKKSLYIESRLTAGRLLWFSVGKWRWRTLTVIAMRPSAECTGLATMAFKTGLPFFSVGKLTSCFLLRSLGISTLKRSVKDEAPRFHPEWWKPEEKKKSVLHQTSHPQVSFTEQMPRTLQRHTLTMLATDEGLDVNYKQIGIWSTGRIQSGSVC